MEEGMIVPKISGKIEFKVPEDILIVSKFSDSGLCCSRRVDLRTFLGKFTN